MSGLVATCRHFLSPGKPAFCALRDWHEVEPAFSDGLSRLRTVALSAELLDVGRLAIPQSSIPDSGPGHRDPPGPAVGAEPRRRRSGWCET